MNKQHTKANLGRAREYAHTHAFTFQIVSLWYLYVDLHALVMVMLAQHTITHFISFSISVSVMPMTALSSVPFIRGVKACDFNHSFCSLVNTVWLGFGSCHGVAMKFHTHILPTSYASTQYKPHCAKREKNHGVLSAPKSLPHTFILSLGLPFFGYYYSISFGLPASPSFASHKHLYA